MDRSSDRHFQLLSRSSETREHLSDVGISTGGFLFSAREFRESGTGDFLVSFLFGFSLCRGLVC